MARDDGFPVMDISTSIVHDPKFRLLHRERPEHVPPAFLAYVAMLGESWKAGRRVSVTDAWPALLPFDPSVVESMILVKLIDRNGLPPRRAWDGWWTPAYERREQARDRWRRANERRNAVPREDSDDTARLPRGTRDVPRPPSVPTVRPSVPSIPSAPSSRATREGRHGLKALTGEDAIRALDAEYAADRITAEEYRERRGKLA